MSGTPALIRRDTIYYFFFIFLGTIFFSKANYRECIAKDKEEAERYHQHKFNAPIVNCERKLTITVPKWQLYDQSKPDGATKADKDRIDLSENNSNVKDVLNKIKSRDCDDETVTVDCNLCRMDYIDAFQMSIVTSSTVGFGDMVPITHSMRMFTAGYGVIAIGLHGNFSGHFTWGFPDDQNKPEIIFVNFALCWLFAFLYQPIYSKIERGQFQFRPDDMFVMWEIITTVGYGSAPPKHDGGKLAIAFFTLIIGGISGHGYGIGGRLVEFIPWTW